MADNTTLDPGTGGDTIATDDVAGVKYPYAKLVDGTADSATKIASGNGTNTNALRVTVASDSTGVVAVTDNGGSLTVDGTVGVSGTVTVDSELTTADLDTGAGTDTRAVVGIALAASGGAVLAGSANPVPISDNSGSITVDNGGTFAVQPTANATVDVNRIAGTATDVNSGNKSAGTQRVVLATDQPQLTNALKVDGSAVTQPVSGTVTANAGTGTFTTSDSSLIADDAAFTVATSKVMPVGFLADQTSTDSVNEGDIGAARMTLDRKVIVTTTASVDTEGASVNMNIDVDETEDAVKASAGKLLGWYIYNDGTSEVYVKFYNNTVAGVTVGTTVPDLTIPIPAGSGSNIDWSGFGGWAFGTALTIAATTGVTTADTGAPATNQVIANVFYL